MTIKTKPVYISATVIDSTMYAIEKYLMGKIGVDAAYRAIEPLQWYITTGRASIDFLGKLIGAKPFMVARTLMKGGSTDEAINAVKNCIKYEEE